MQIFFNRDKFHKIKNLKKLDFFCKLFEQNIINYNISNNFFVKDISSPNYLRDNSIIFIN